MDPQEIRLRCLEAAVTCFARGKDERVLSPRWDVPRLAENFVDYVVNGEVPGREKASAG